MNVTARIPSVPKLLIIEMINRYESLQRAGACIDRHVLLAKVQTKQSRELHQFCDIDKNLHELVAIHNPLIDIQGKKKQEVKKYFLSQQARFPKKLIACRTRVNNAFAAREKMRENGIRARFDIAGMQIVPLDTAKYVSTVLGVAADEYETLYALNTFMYSDDDFRKKIGKDSVPFYRAIHLYKNVAGVFVEIQVRPKYTDLWSMVHHATMYKPIIKTTRKERRAVLWLGMVANVLDFTDLLRAETTDE